MNEMISTRAALIRSTSPNHDVSCAYCVIVKGYGLQGTLYLLIEFTDCVFLLILLCLVFLLAH